MKIVKLKAENIKKLVAVEIAPNGNLVKITGKNASGKTSVLDSIWWGLGGSQNIQEEPIRKGEKKASIEIDLGEMVVKRTFNEGGTTALTIENKDGLRFKSPQTLLDGLMGKLSFDPLEFMRQEPKKQFETLKALTGVDFSKLDAMRQKAYDERTAVNRDIKKLEVQIEGFTIPAEPKEPQGEEIDVSAIIAQVNAAVQQNNELQKLKQDAEHAETHRFQSEEKVRSIESRIADLHGALQKAREDLRAASDTAVFAHNEAIRLNKIIVETKTPDIEPLRLQLAQAEENNNNVRLARGAYESLRREVAVAKKYREERDGELKTAKDAAQTLTEKIEAIDTEKQNMIAAAKFPLDGLGFGNGAVVYNDIPLSQASSAEQLRVSMAMAMALNPKLRVLRIADGSLLDSSSMKIVEEMANGNDYQIWVEVVDESGKVGVVIEDGQVAAVN